MKLSSILRYLFVLFALLWLLLEVIPGRFVQTDEVFFKSAGRHWAATGQFAAPEIVGRLEVQPSLDVIYFAQPPLYTFVFGLYTKLVGFGPHRCILFDCLIHILFVSLTIVLARRNFRVPACYAYSLGLIMLPLGTVGRPDELAVCLAILGILSWTIEWSPLYRSLLAGFFFGLCGCTSIGVLLFLSPMTLLVAYQRHLLSTRTLVTALVTGIVVAVLCISPILIPHPDAYHQLLAHASAQSPELGARIVTGHNRVTEVLYSWVNGIRFALRFGTSISVAVVGSVVASGLLLFGSTVSKPLQNRQDFWIIVGGMLALWVLLPGKYTYLWFFAPWSFCLVASIFSAPSSSPLAIPRLAARALVAISIAIGFLLYARNKVLIVSLPKHERFDVNMADVRNRIPTGARVMTAQYWWALADKCQVFDPQFSLLNPISIDYIIKDGNGSGRPGAPVMFRPEYEKYQKDADFIVVEDDLNRHPLRVAGIPLARAAYGFGPLIMEKASDLASMPKPEPKK